jgi:hypothetical protein
VYAIACGGYAGWQVYVLLGTHYLGLVVDPRTVAGELAGVVISQSRGLPVVPLDAAVAGHGWQECWIVRT